MRILGISGSLRADSSNTALLRAASALAPVDMQITLYEGLRDLPHFSPEIDTGDPPATVTALRRQLTEADGVLFCTPEYAFGVPGVLKNALDWCVSSGELDTKPVAVISASPLERGADRAQASLLLTLSALGARVADGATLTIPFVRRKIRTDNAYVSDPDTADAICGLLSVLAAPV